MIRPRESGQVVEFSMDLEIGRPQVSYHDTPPHTLVASKSNMKNHLLVRVKEGRQVDDGGGRAASHLPEGVHSHLVGHIIIFVHSTLALHC